MQWGCSKNTKTPFLKRNLSSLIPPLSATPRSRHGGRRRYRLFPRASRASATLRTCALDPPLPSKKTTLHTITEKNPFHLLDPRQRRYRPLSETLFCDSDAEISRASLEDRHFRFSAVRERIPGRRIGEDAAQRGGGRSSERDVVSDEHTLFESLRCGDRVSVAVRAEALAADRSQCLAQAR